MTEPASAYAPVHPATRLAASLVASLVLWLPSALACLRGDIDLPAAGLRYLAALALAKLTVGLLAHLVASYRGGAEGPPPRRRRDDPPLPAPAGE